MVDTRRLTKPSRRKGTPPLPTEASVNLGAPPIGQKVPLQLKISPELRREFKAYAAERDTELSTLFATMWAFYRAHHG
jgi:hypothetical protein